MPPAKPFMTAAMAIDRPHHPGVGSRARGLALSLVSLLSRRRLARGGVMTAAEAAPTTARVTATRTRVLEWRIGVVMCE